LVRCPRLDYEGTSDNYCRRLIEQQVDLLRLTFAVDAFHSRVRSPHSGGRFDARARILGATEMIDVTANGANGNSVPGLMNE
jgi:hypothetical protein